MTANVIGSCVNFNGSYYQGDATRSHALEAMRPAARRGFSSADQIGGPMITFEALPLRPRFNPASDLIRPPMKDVGTNAV